MWILSQFIAWDKQIPELKCKIPEGISSSLRDFIVLVFNIEVFHINFFLIKSLKKKIELHFLCPLQGFRDHSKEYLFVCASRLIIIVLIIKYKFYCNSAIIGVHSNKRKAASIQRVAPFSLPYLRVPLLKLLWLQLPVSWGGGVKNSSSMSPPLTSYLWKSRGTALLRGASKIMNWS